MSFVENINEFNRWLDQMLKDAKEKLNMTDGTIAWILFQRANYHYFRSFNKQEKRSEPP